MIGVESSRISMYYHSMVGMSTNPFGDDSGLFFCYNDTATSTIILLLCKNITPKPIQIKKFIGGDNCSIESQLWLRMSKHIEKVDFSSIIFKKYSQISGFNFRKQAKFFFQKDMEDNCFFVAFGNLLGSCGYYYDIKKV